MAFDVIWFNQWFSSIYHTITQIKQEFDVRIIGTSRNPDHTYCVAVDQFFVEPVFEHADDYVNWALHFCREHRITIFFPKAFNRKISEQKELFSQIGVTVVMEDFELFRCFDSKAGVYHTLEGVVPLPPYKIAKNRHDFEEAVGAITETGARACFKFDKDEGAASFRFISDVGVKAYYLKTPGGSNVTYQQAISILEDAEENGKFRPLMVMPLLKEPEVSVDCYQSAKGFVAVPRFKENKRVEIIRYDSNIIEHCQRIQEKFRFALPYNVQFRWNEADEAVLLEINPRLSGGVHMSAFSNRSIIRYLLCDLLHMDYEIAPFKNVKISQLEYPVVL